MCRGFIRLNYSLIPNCSFRGPSSVSNAAKNVTGKSSAFFVHVVASLRTEFASRQTGSMLSVVGIALMLTGLFALSEPQDKSRPQPSIPRFEDYPVTEIFKGPPASPVLDSAPKRLFRTRIRRGLKTGKGVMRDGKEQPGPNFAGHYIIVEWPCGSPCEMDAVVDAGTGQVYEPPLSPGFLLPLLPALVPGNPKVFVPWVAELEFRLNSSLLIMKANPDPVRERVNHIYYFLWKGNQWRLLKKVPLQPRSS